MEDTKKAIEKIRESRKRMSRECHDDSKEYIERLKAFNKKYESQVQKYAKKHAAKEEEP